MKKIVAVVVLMLLTATQGFAWGNAGHEIVAYLAYKNLKTDALRAQVDALVAKNPCYVEWQTAVKAMPKLAPEDQSVALYMLAATWPDKIKNGTFVPPYKCQPDLKFIFDGGKGMAPGAHASQDIPPHDASDPTSVAAASQNIGYSDTRRHRYWHFIDMPYTQDGTVTYEAWAPNAMVEIKTLSDALASSEDDNLKSYDLVWLTHLTGDIHQPLHGAQRFTKGHPYGDAGGNLVATCTTAKCSAELHGFWDALPGSGSDLQGAINNGKRLNADLPDAGSVNPAAWAAEGFALAKSDVYVAPITDDEPGSKPASPDANYKKNAMGIADKQLKLAGVRLERMLETDLGK
jgi:hypothetical protein